jgi:hypothetical protein
MASEKVGEVLSWVESGHLSRTQNIFLFNELKEMCFA